MNYILPSLMIIISALIPFVIVNTDLDIYNPYIIGSIVFIFVVRSLIRKRKNPTSELFTGSYLEIGLLLISIYLLVFLTGGIKSPIFFLLYFLLFGITVMYDPVIIFIFTCSVIFLFLQQSLTDDILSNMIKLGLMLVVSPFAYIFGREYKKKEESITKLK